ncbi:MAG: GH25 family lysozyme [Hyphomonadaceae bacterium]|nr:GH25 family lysozyme [Hyphomonadaceae bacterium]
MTRAGLLWAGLGVGAIVAAAGLLLASGFWSPWAHRFVQGVDVSRHQGPIDWRTLARGDIRFAYIKATEGGDYVDPLFAAHWRGAGEAGIARGAYHFFTLCRSGALQAAHFIGVMPRDAELPPAVDLEHMGPCRRGPTMTDIPREVDIYLDAVERATGRRPILYTTRQFHDAHLTRIAGERFWVRSLFRWPQFRRRDWVIWQHHNKGARPGVQGPVDLNSFRGDAAAFAAFAGSAP